MTADNRKVLMPHEAAEVFGVDPRTLSKWARDGKVPHFVTPGGHRRYYEDQCQDVIKAWTGPVEEGK